MIVLTGAAGFIGSCLLSELNNRGIEDIILVDDFTVKQKESNYADKKFVSKIERNQFINWFRENNSKIKFVFHIGARTDTAEFNMEILNELNLEYTKSVWNICASAQIPLVYASSAATYGLGEYGYEEDESKLKSLKPLNPYGISKNEFDKWALEQKQTPPFWAGFKFFNVYGPNEYHKARMASVIFHAFNQVNEKGVVKLFKSHNPKYKDGGQMRDFVYVKDVVNVLCFTYATKIPNGIYNLGSGKARTFEDLAKATFQALSKEAHIEFIDTPADIRDKYQYFTEANMQKLIKAGYNSPFTSLEEGVNDYVCNYLTKGHRF